MLQWVRRLAAIEKYWMLMVILQDTLPAVSWAKKIRPLAKHLLDSTGEYVADNFFQLVKADCFTQMTATCWGRDAIPDLCGAVWMKLKPNRVFGVFGGINHLVSGKLFSGCRGVHLLWHFSTQIAFISHTQTVCVIVVVIAVQYRYPSKCSVVEII